MSKAIDHRKLSRKRIAHDREVTGAREASRYYQSTTEREPPPRPPLRDSRGRPISLAPVSILKAHKGRSEA